MITVVKYSEIKTRLNNQRKRQNNHKNDENNI